jgi:hypothetical protein
VPLSSQNEVFGDDAALSSPALTLSDGRQSPGAMEIARGVGRCLANHGFSAVSEVTLANTRRADIMAVSEAGEIWIVEIKSSVEDFRADQKWPEYRDFSDRFFFAVQTSFPRDLIPDGVGLILADRFGGEVVRSAPSHKLVASRRKAVLIRFARTAGMRLQTALDPDMRRYVRGWPESV